jgi:hypothetical protein
VAIAAKSLASALEYGHADLDPLCRRLPASRPGRDPLIRELRNKIMLYQGRRSDLHKAATRASRQLANALQSQGLKEEAVRFAIRAEDLRTKMLFWDLLNPPLRYGVEPRGKGSWLQQQAATSRTFLRASFRTAWHDLQVMGAVAFSTLLRIVAGYGYRPGWTASWYVATVLTFAGLYVALGHLSFWPDALTFSVTSFHGRGLTTFLPGNSFSDPNQRTVVELSAAQAVLGLMIEATFIAAFAKRFLDR